LKSSINKTVLPALLLALALLPGRAGAADGWDAAPADPPRMLVHLLDYLSQDYAGAVGPDRKVLSASEYREQKEFAKTASGIAQGCAMAPGAAQDGRALKRLIDSRAAPARVSAAAQALKAKVIKSYGIPVAPESWPDLTEGRKLYAQNCAACHGETGRGDGPQGLALSPRPASFHNSELMDTLSPFRAFNTVREGVPGTKMPSFAGAFSDKETWALAFYVMSLRYEDDAEARRAAAGVDETLLADASSLSDARLFSSLPGDEGQRRRKLAAVRLHSRSGPGAGSTLARGRELLARAADEYGRGLFAVAEKDAISAYLEGVEPVEPRLRASDPGAVVALEERMSAVRAAISARRPKEQVLAAVSAAGQALDSAQGSLEGQGSSAAMILLVAMGIVLREGFEAVVIVLVLLAVVRAADARKAQAWVHAGWLAALALGAAAWVLSGRLMTLGSSRELVEGVTSAVAVAVLLYVGFWLHSRSEISEWKRFVHGQVRQALEGGKLWGLAGISFMAVFREIFETVLFLRASVLEGGRGAEALAAAGAAAALILVLVCAWALLRYSVRLPVRELFAFSAATMAALAVILAGQAAHSLQEAGVLGVVPAPIHWRLESLGIFPTVQVWLAQLAALAVTAVLWRLSSRRPSGSGPRPEKPIAA
jgi:high-affinity iron transporter